MKKLLLIIYILYICFGCSKQTVAEEAKELKIQLFDLAFYNKQVTLEPVMVGHGFYQVAVEHKLKRNGYENVNLNLQIDLPFKTIYKFSVRQQYLRDRSTRDDTYIFSSGRNIDLICTYDVNYTTTRGVKVSDNTTQIIEKYGDPKKIIDGDKYQLYEYRNQIEHPLFREVVIVFQIENNFISSIAMGGVYKSIYVVIPDDFKLYETESNSELKLGMDKLPTLKDVKFTNTDYPNPRSKKLDLSFYHSESLDYAVQKNSTGISFYKAMNAKIKTHRGLKVGDTVDRLYELYGDFYDLYGENYRGFQYYYKPESLSPEVKTVYLYFYFENNVITKIVLFNDSFEYDNQREKIDSISNQVVSDFTDNYNLSYDELIK